MANIRKRLDNVLAELTIIVKALKHSGHYPSCCLTVYSDGKISCDGMNPLGEKEFLEKCEKCRMQIEKIVSRLNLAEIQSQEV